MCWSPRASLLVALLACVACTAPGSAGPRTTPVAGLPVFAEAPGPALPWLSGGFAVDDDDDEDEQEESASPVSIGWGILMYLPNRVLDILDVVRARVRLGPGIAIGVRATEYADVFVGTYTSIYVGLPGPRGRRFPRLPVGLESKTGAEVSVADVTVEGGMSPDYGMTECGAGFQILLVGVDVGVDIFEIGDLLVGFLTFDPMDDDF